MYKNQIQLFIFIKFTKKYVIQQELDIFILIYLNKEYNKTILFMFQYNLIKNASLLINIMLIIRVIYIIIVIIIVNYE